MVLLAVVRLVFPERELSPHDFFLVYVSLEVARITVCFGVFATMWTTREFETRLRSMVIGLTFLCVSGLFFLRLLSNLSLHSYVGVESSQTALYLRTFGRWSVVVFIAVASYIPYRRIAAGSTPVVLLAAAVAYVLVLGVLAQLYSGQLPPLVASTGGATTVAQSLAAIAVALFLIVAYRFVRQAIDHSDSVYVLLACAMVLSVAAEEAFAFVDRESDALKLVGNFIGASTFILVFVAIVRTTVLRPYEELDRAKRQIERDREALKSANLELKRSSEKYMNLADSIGDALFAMDKDLRYTYWNKSSELLTGIKADKAIGKSLFEIFPEARGSRVEKLYREVLATEKPKTIVDPWKLGDRDLCFELSAYPTEDGLCVFTRDVTSRQEAEAAVREAERRYHIAADYSYDWEGWVGPEGRHIYLSPSCERITGYSPRALLDDPELLSRIFHPEDSEMLARHERERPDHGPSQPLEFKIMSRDGHPVWIEHVCQAVYGEGGKLLGRRYTNRDITLRKQVEHDLELTLTELKRANADLEQFASAASHDLQEPLRMISSYLQLLSTRYEGKLDKDADTYIGFAVDGSNRLQKMITDLLEFSRVGTRGRPFAPVDSGTVLDRALMNLKMAIEESGAEVTVEKLPQVLADETQLMLLFQNLVGNSIKFRGTDPPRVRISARRDGEKWVFSVKDNGIGIDPKQHDKLFVIFRRLHSRDKYPGTGIGLAMCRRIVERHGGRIWIESELGRGATFLFTLPAA